MEKSHFTQSRYEQLKNRNIIAPVIHLIVKGVFNIEDDHKIYLDNHILPERPWLNSKMDPERDCGKWNEVYFKYYRIIPKACRDCWKIFFTPRTLTELVRVRHLQDKMGLMSKCGAETRPHSGNKGGYLSVWYAPLDGGLKQAREIHSLIDAKLQTLFGKEEKRTVIIKRGCTEMEHFTQSNFNLGSDRWDEIAKKFSYDAREMLLDTVWVSRRKIVDVPTYAYEHIEQLLIDYAFENGDETYLEFTDNVPHTKPLVTFNNSKHKHQEFKSDWRLHGPDNNKSDNAGKIISIDRKLDGTEDPIIQGIPE